MKAGNLTINWHHFFADDSAPHKGAAHFNTSCLIGKKDNALPWGIGYSICATGDMFCKEKGRKLSLGRAMQNAQLPKEERKVIWELYRNMKQGGRW